MTLPLPSNTKDSITAESVACHLNAEPNLPGAEDLDLDLITRWILTLKLELRLKEVKRLAPKVLDELRAMDGITAEEAARHQQRYPVKRDDPVLVYAWGSSGDVRSKPETVPRPTKAAQQHSAWEVVGKKRTAKQAEQQASVGVEGNDKAGGVKLNDNATQPDAKQTAIDAAVSKKKANKAAKRARKAARNLENAKPPVGKKEEDSEDDGNDSDWTQTSWSPSWASDSEEDGI
ncbi:hypothetical protein QM012_001324 [Aureobasidium pullulans]|uniref:Uncharacterized protein n=1 Tax=Aureobasidium pullulans TaxID=5580 RepID=A0ABR0TE94_AURPU